METRETDYRMTAEDHALFERRVAAKIALKKIAPCPVCHGTGDRRTREQKRAAADAGKVIDMHEAIMSDDIFAFKPDNQCPACNGDGSQLTPPFADAFPLAYRQWLTLSHPDFLGEPVIVTVDGGEVRHSAQVGNLLVDPELADVTDFQSPDDILGKARRAGFRVRYLDR